MGRDHFRTRRLAKVATEMSLHILAYNLKRAVAVLSTPVLIAASRLTRAAIGPDSSSGPMG
jgi:hypothetical protein